MPKYVMSNIFHCNEYQMLCGFNISLNCIHKRGHTIPQEEKCHSSRKSYILIPKKLQSQVNREKKNSLFQHLYDVTSFCFSSGKQVRQLEYRPQHGYGHQKLCFRPNKKHNFQRKSRQLEACVQATLDNTDLNIFVIGIHKKVFSFLSSSKEPSIPSSSLRGHSLLILARQSGWA